MRMNNYPQTPLWQLPKLIFINRLSNESKGVLKPAHTSKVIARKAFTLTPCQLRMRRIHRA